MGSIQQALISYGSGGSSSTVAALLHFDGANGATTTTDATGKTVTMFGSAKLGTAQSVFGGASLDNTGGSGRVEIAHSADFNFGTGAFCIEWRERRTANTDYQNSFSRGYNLAGGMFLQSPSPGSATKTLYFVDSGGTARAVIDGIPTTPLDTWVAWAIQRDATGDLRCFHNGVHVSGSSSGTYNQLSLGLTAPFVIGADSASSYWFRGWIDEFRVQKGVAPYSPAGYTIAGSAFTYP